ncbi:MAG: PEP-CTERM sorting domain-containing protein [Pontiellaceae bacterium]|nr:PEP-CTERM sorting domain-containing protein [Pontiellaceae bacterium]
MIMRIPFILVLALLPLWGRGDIVFSAFEGDLTPASPANELFLDINHDGLLDFKFTSLMDSPLYYVNIENAGSGGMILLPNQAGVLNTQLLKEGDCIDGSALGGNAVWGSNTGIVSYRNLQFQTGLVKGGLLETNAFLGISFKIDSETHYGWIQIDNSTDIPGGTVTGFAYETEPNTAITAVVIPEPGTVGLLSVGWLAMCLMRKKIH